ncbi:hypothetical protein EJ05DRAFT_471581 [Pseudovirgaria hyperparasitica]|uniref:Uncharacterized protein n=1 Tax=Pseudovirgaria hyperparasitica TaxID=470096 RepID=A0A6A6WKA2_9PEZI|nr:uncharacterized protein EJ05DRAFT_471581 [Pseudovirgaria hyperparasitica]KAF2762595.1 hypothetical protein EJ05DRAFT_471581 [Pseudovirgaria hyperparasitica]
MSHSRTLRFVARLSESLGSVIQGRQLRTFSLAQPKYQTSYHEGAYGHNADYDTCDCAAGYTARGIWCL